VVRSILQAATLLDILVKRVVSNPDSMALQAAVANAAKQGAKRYHGPMRVPSDRSIDSELESLRAQIWQQLVHATGKREHEWRTPVLASVDADGLPQARTVVLRQADPIAGMLQIYTDSRSPKVAELLGHPDAVLVFWSRSLSWQLRARVTVQVQSDGDLVEAAWEEVSRTAAAADYLAPAAPGSVFSLTAQGNHRTHHLAVLLARIEALDWLELSRDGHRRVRFDESGACRLIP
jgi:pyridoxine/pyridoxamine 5'-phosphate oxidase